MRLRMLAGMALLGVRMLAAQSVQPVISEYKGRADGKFAVTNTSDAPMVVLLEPKSFNIMPDGRGVFRQLDAAIHVELSTMSLKLAAHQTAYVFYKADAEAFPAWFTVYATFSAPRHDSDLDVRILLPHTVYLYQKNPLMLNDVHVTSAAYSAKTNKLVYEVENDGHGLGRVQDSRATGSHEMAEGGGFPMLPGSRRHVEVAWTGKRPPSAVELHFEHFTVKQAVSIDDAGE